MLEVESVAFGVPVHAVSAPHGDGVETVRSYIPHGRTAALLGSSGVGKSTLVNALVGEEVLATNEVREDGRGRHTTSHRELVPLPQGGVVLDTPGMREIQLWDAASGLESAFQDLDALAAECRFADCAHGPSRAARSVRRSRTGRSTGAVRELAQARSASWSDSRASRTHVPDPTRERSAPASPRSQRNTAY